jgi:hypothetical protein
MRRLSPRRPLPATAAGLLFAAAMAAGSGTASAEPFSVKYDVYFGGLHVLNAQANWEQGAAAYSIAAQAETQGFVGWLHPWQGNTSSQGRIDDGKVVPARHENRGSADDDEADGERLVHLTYDAAGNLADSLVQPEQDWEERHPLPANAGAGTLDPLSVIAGLSQLLQKTGRCEGSFAVFDGRKRYNLMVSDAGETQLDASNYSIYAGPARGCRLDYEMLGGHRIERSKYAETARERIVWVARPAEDAPLVPVRLEIETAYGTLMGHLTGFAQGLQAEAKLTE